jgi:cyanophycin synthetase
VRLVWAVSFEGRNLHCARPVLEALVDLGDLAEVTTADRREAADRLVGLLPELADHHCGLGRRGGFGERMREGTLWGHVAEHVALELLWQAGERVRYGKTRLAQPPAVYRLVVEQETPGLGRPALRMAIAGIDALLAGHAFDPAVAVRRLAAERAARQPGPSTRALLEAAQQRDIPVRHLGGSLYEFGQGKHLRRLWASLSDSDGAVAVDIAQDKALTRSLLAEAGIPVPAGRCVARADEAVAAFRSLGPPVVVKPVRGRQGCGVRTCLRNPAAVRRAFATAQAEGGRVMVERQASGAAVRVLVVGGRAVAASVRHPPEVVGDGAHSVRDLAEALNAEPGRGEGHAAPLTRVDPRDPEVVSHLRDQGLDLDSVPPPGRRVELRRSANMSTGATAEDVTDRIHPALARLAERAAAKVGLAVAGVDMVVPDLAAAACEVLEVNAAPGLRMHLWPTRGDARPVARAIVDALVSGSGRVPVVAITGTNGKTTTARLVAHLLRGAGFTVGLATTDGVEVAGERLKVGDCAGPRSAAAVLGDPRVEAAVLECARGGLRRRGLGFDRCQVSCVLNVAADHLGQDGIDSLDDLAHLKALVVEATASDGQAVLNADDPRVRAMACLTSAEKVWFSAGAGHSAAPLSRRAVLERAGHLVYRDGGREHRLLAVSRVPIAFGGAARPMVANALAAAAVALSLGLTAETVAEGLSTFDGGARSNPGRMNLWRAGAARILLDYAHNAPAVSALFATARALCSGRLLGVVCAPGDRRDEDIMALGAAAGRGLDRLWIKEDADLRGRRPGEVADLIARGAVEAGAAPAVVGAEADAVARALAEAKAGDLVILLYETYDAVCALLRGLGAVPEPVGAGAGSRPAASAAKSPRV